MPPLLHPLSLTATKPCRTRHLVLSARPLLPVIREEPKILRVGPALATHARPRPRTEAVSALLRRVWYQLDSEGAGSSILRFVLVDTRSVDPDRASIDAICCAGAQVGTRTQRNTVTVERERHLRGLLWSCRCDVLRQRSSSPLSRTGRARRTALKPHNFAPYCHVTRRDPVQRERRPASDHTSSRRSPHGAESSTTLSHNPARVSSICATARRVRLNNNN